MFENAGKPVPAYCTSDTGINTDWQDLMLRNGLSQNYMFSVRGGSETAQYSVSYNHADDKGIFLGNNFRQDNARMKMHMSKYIFDIDANLSSAIPRANSHSTVCVRCTVFLRCFPFMTRMRNTALP